MTAESTPTPSPRPSPARIVLYASDLMFTAKVGATARAAGVPIVVVRTAAAMAERLGADEGTALLIVDLDAAGAVDAIGLASRAAGVPAPGMPDDAAVRPAVIAFVSHVRADLAAAARAAGADQVLARSAFVAGLESLVAGVRGTRRPADAPASRPDARGTIVE